MKRYLCYWWCYSFIFLFDDTKVNIALAGLANKEGRELASQFMLKKKNDIKPLGTSILKIFSLAAASTGLTEEQLKQKRLIMKRYIFVQQTMQVIIQMPQL